MKEGTPLILVFSLNVNPEAITFSGGGKVVKLIPVSTLHCTSSGRGASDHIVS